MNHEVRYVNDGSRAGTRKQTFVTTQWRALSQSGHTITSPPMNAVIRSSNQISSIFDNPSYPNLRAHRSSRDKSNKVEQRSLCQLYLVNDVLKTFRSHVRLVHPISFETTSSTHPSNHSRRGSHIVNGTENDSRRACLQQHHRHIIKDKLLIIYQHLSSASSNVSKHVGYSLQDKDIIGRHES